MLARVREHLAPGGKFLVNIGFKPPATMLDSTEEEEWFSYTAQGGRQATVVGTDYYDPIKQLWNQTWTRRWFENGRPIVTPPEELTLRYFMPQEIEALRTYNGFSILSRYGDWDGSPFTGDSNLQIYLCTVWNQKEVS